MVADVFDDGVLGHHEPFDDLWVQCGAARRDASDRIEELVKIDDSVFE